MAEFEKKKQEQNLEPYKIPKEFLEKHKEYFELREAFIKKYNPKAWRSVVGV